MEFRYRLKKKKKSSAEEAQHIDEPRPSEPFLEEGSPADTPFSSSTSSGNDTTHTDSLSTPAPAMSKASDWRKDKLNIGLLLFLYLLQGIPLGMASSLPLIIQTYGANWSQQATFSFAFWPFSLKLLWAPIVDALYVKKLGRRKSWLIPTQYLIGIMMMILSYYVNNILLSIQTPADSRKGRFACERRPLTSCLSVSDLPAHVGLLRPFVSGCYARRVRRWLGAFHSGKRERRLGEHVQLSGTNRRHVHR